jgi:glycosyltransferase involved in cell wall biosynthesis
MRLTVLSVAYPLTAVGPDAVGGSEQILTHLDCALTRAGHRSLVVACEGSSVAGELISTPRWDGNLTDDVRRWAQAQHRIAIEQALEEHHIDVIHMHSLDWHAYLPAPGPPLLATLHLPPDWYPDEVFRLRRPRTYLNCVSRAERNSCPPCEPPMFVVENGVPVDMLYSRVRKRNYVLALGRVCPEKGLHIALDAAKRARAPMILAGEVYRYEAHLRYYEQEILPRLDAQRKFRGSAGFLEKRRLMTGARCLLAPSLVAETSSLVAMEALACGTPVIAFPSGALPEVVEHGRTGFIVHNEQEMADAIHAAAGLDPEECRRVARERFSSERMARDYLELYQQIARDRDLDGGQAGVIPGRASTAAAAPGGFGG